MTRVLSVELSDDAALVLFDFLSRVNRAYAAIMEDQAEARVLWDIEADLERALDVVVARDYEAQVQEARSRVRDHP